MRTRATKRLHARSVLPRAGAVTVTLAFVLGTVAPAATVEESHRAIPSGYRIERSARVAVGLDHLVLSGPTQRVHLARVQAGSKLELRPVLAGGALNGAPEVERTSAMCARVRCLAAVNGDFFSLPGVPSGAVVADGEPVRSASSKRRQLLVDEGGSLTTGALRFEIVLVSSDLERLSLDGVNVPLGRDRTVLYTARFGRSTGAPASAFEIPLRIERPGGRLQVGETAAARILAPRAGGDSAIPRDGAVLAARGRDAARLRALWKRIEQGAASPEVLVRVDATPSATESLGGRPVLVRGGKPVAPEDDSVFAQGRHPRTIVGRTREGHVLLVTVDGRQPGYSRGMTLKEAAELMIGLGAVEAINLDGGGSTTFVVEGRVVNRPSDRLVRRAGRRLIATASQPGDTVLGTVERPVAIALAVVAPDAPATAAGDAGRHEPGRRDAAALGALASPAPVALDPPTERDPASNPDGALPAIVLAEPKGPTAREGLLALAALLWGFAASGLGIIGPRTHHART